MSETADSGFLDIVRERKETLGMTLKDLSEESGLSLETISQILNEEITPTESERSLLKLALDFK